jgi:hypothetical protein
MRQRLRGMESFVSFIALINRSPVAHTSGLNARAMSLSYAK